MERLFSTPFILVHVERQGCAYFPKEDLASITQHDFVGQRIDECIDAAPLPIQLALTDALFATLSEVIDGSQRISLDGTVSSKASKRARLVAAEVAELLKQTPAEQSVSLLGYSGEIANALRAVGANVISYDLDLETAPDGGHAGSVTTVRHGNLFLADAPPDLVVATGMTLVTDTFAKIRTFCLQQRIPLVMYCQTAANLGGFLVSHYDVDVVVAEHVPFYNWEGRSIVTVHRRAV
jgi:hypothetical protein